MKKRWISLILALAMLAALAVPAIAATPIIKKTEYQGRGYVEVDFMEKVSYQNPKVTVSDAAGNTYTAKITERDSADLTFRISGIRSNTRYTYRISGVRSRVSGTAIGVIDSFKTPVTELAIREVDYSARDRELEIEFYGLVQYKNPKVTVRDTAGRTYTAVIVEKESRELEVRVAGLVKGRKYTVSVSGLRLRGGSQYTSVSKKFTA